jgi:hypothetical protein
MGLHHAFIINVLFTGVIVTAEQLMPESSTFEVGIAVKR